MECLQVFDTSIINLEPLMTYFWILRQLIDSFINLFHARFDNNGISKRILLIHKMDIISWSQNLQHSSDF